MKLVTVVGARPQFIKAAALSRCIKQDYHKTLQEVIIHTGQHYDENMSDVFFRDLGIPLPKFNLAVGAAKHGEMTAKMLKPLEEIFLVEQPDRVLVYGDTNSTLAAALAASKLHIPIAHVEAGLRSFNRRMPEEINRIVTDKLSDYLLCPTQEAVDNLRREGKTDAVHLVGDVMYDNALFFANQADQKSLILDKLGLKQNSFVLLTCHRAENTDVEERLSEILKGVNQISKYMPVLFPLHPRTRQYINRYQLTHYMDKIITIDPLPYLDMVALEQAAYVIMTDSGGVQKEAFFYETPCITLRDETEWVETLTLGWNQLVGADAEKMYSAFKQVKKGVGGYFPYGDGRASWKIIRAILEPVYV